MGQAFAGMVSTQEREAELMGTTAHVIVTGAEPGLAARAVERLRLLEARWSRFLPDSEISRLNEHPGVPVLVSHDTYLLVERAIEGWRLTGGLFDPTLLRELRAAGYDRSFELMRAGASAPDDRPADAGARPPDRATLRPTTDAITLDPLVRTVRLPFGVELDPGGIGKGLAADLVVEELRAQGATGADGTRRHHLIDPATGVPAATGLSGVTVITGSGWHAEVLAKAAFLAGPTAGAELLADRGVAGLLVRDDGSMIEAGDLGRFAVGPIEQHRVATPVGTPE
jgi:thiamine biosynthesis lipoprotein